MSILLEKIISAVKEALPLTNVSFSVKEKDGARNIVTSADLAVEKFLHGRLSEILPEADFLGEEEDGDPKKDLFFVVDPIDGTANFSRSLGYSAISVGLIKNGEPFIGVVCDIKTGEIYSAEKGCGAYIGDKRISVSDRSFSDSLFLTAFSLYRPEYSGYCMKILEKIYPECNDFRRFGSAALEICYLAKGTCELYFEARLYPWDVAAALVILSEAGGFYESPYFETIDFSKPMTIVAANSLESLLKLKKTVIEEMPAPNKNFYKLS